MEHELYGLADLDRLEGAYELDEGRLVPIPPRLLAHGRVSMRIAALLFTHCEATGEGVALGQGTGCVLQRHPDTVRAPVAAVISQARWQRSQAEKWLEGSPDLVVEVSSPAAACERKVAQYRQGGAQLVWVIDPKRRSVLCYQGDGTMTVAEEGQALSAAPVLPGFSYPVADLFESLS